jgi:hypothetical protein
LIVTSLDNRESKKVPAGMKAPIHEAVSVHARENLPLTVNVRLPIMGP